ncbi:immunity 53 family protein [Paenibacillus sp. GD4]|uniref:immunity 53 family protein n=1 Tax=Paenibacillus sp. GD4 TaxID=3068890 RepID=UPI002796C184|nr:immunity 53 family protein [Paenibacillus sp. GD4]MDQ1913729.1 immunity 53 family protein [Paenibacillus sp. GD4]
MLNNLKKLQTWYLSQCDGDWEHMYGIRVSTVDNPGWYVEVNIAGTTLEGRSFESIRIDREDRDWIFCRVENNTFIGAGGPSNLDEILGVFNSWSCDNSGGINGR